MRYASFRATSTPKVFVENWIHTDELLHNFGEAIGEAKHALSMQPYSVLLSYPVDWEGKVETYLAHVHAPSSGGAIVRALKDMKLANEWEDLPDDVQVLLVCEGHIQDINP
jgi:hypothetical protein